MMFVIGIVLVCGRLFIIVVVMYRLVGNSGVKLIWYV